MGLSKTFFPIVNRVLGKVSGKLRCRNSIIFSRTLTRKFHAEGESTALINVRTSNVFRLSWSPGAHLPFHPGFYHYLKSG